MPPPPSLPDVLCEGTGNGGRFPFTLLLFSMLVSFLVLVLRLVLMGWGGVAAVIDAREAGVAQAGRGVCLVGSFGGGDGAVEPGT